jgi:integrase/recombinase XerD
VASARAASRASQRASRDRATAAVDDFYIRRDLGPANAVRVDVPATSPRAIGPRAQVRYLRAVAACPSPRDQALALVPFYAGARISEIVALDVVNAPPARGCSGSTVRVDASARSRSTRSCEAPWRTGSRSGPSSPGAEDSPALFLNQRGRRLSVKAAHDIITGIAADAGLGDSHRPRPGPHVRHQLFTSFRAGTDLVIVAELLGHARLETTRGYTRPTAEDRTKARDLLLVDK